MWLHSLCTPPPPPSSLLLPPPPHTPTHTNTATINITNFFIRLPPAHILCFVSVIDSSPRHVRQEAGREGNDYMGVAIAFPKNRFDMQRLHTVRVAGTKPWFSERQPWLSTFAAYIPVWVRRILRQPLQAIPSTQELAKDRTNSMILVRLLDKMRNGRAVNIATFHMPCQFQFPRVMVCRTCSIPCWLGVQDSSMTMSLFGLFRSYTPHCARKKRSDKQAMSRSFWQATLIFRSLCCNRMRMEVFFLFF